MAHADGLADAISKLADAVKSRGGEIGLAESAGATALLITSLQSHISALNTRIYVEFKTIADYIEKARSEIGALQSHDVTQERIPRAGAELYAIVSSTEEATGTIMSAAEDMMGADPSDMEAYQATVNDACLKIFEACSFQDITGQRISKVVETLEFIEERLMRLNRAVGPGKEVAPAEEDERSRRKRELILHGPALAGEGVDQAEVDALLGGGEPSAPKPAPKPPAKPAKAKPAKAEDSKETGEEGDAAAGGSISQDDIDAMFG